MRNLIFTTLILSGFTGMTQDTWTGSYLCDLENAKGSHEIITISKRDGCYFMTWGTASGKYPMKVKEIPVKCDAESEENFKFIITLWEYEKYELGPVKKDESGRVMEFDILGFDEPQVFKRIK